MPTIDQIEIRRGTSSGRVETTVYNIGASGGVDAANVSYDDSSTHLGANNVQTAIQKIKTNFQVGVDAVYDAVVAKGSTPASHSLSDVIAGIGNIPTGITPTGTFVYTGSEGSWTQDISSYKYADASNVYTKGVTDGQSQVVIGTVPVFIQSGAGENDSVDLYIYNNTGKTMRIAFFVKLEGNDRSFIVNNEELWPIWYSSYKDLPTGTNVHLYQRSKQTADARPGQIDICVIGTYNNVQDTREFPDSSTTGTITFT